VEIKSTDQLREDHAASLVAMQDAFPDADFFLLSRDPNPQRFGKIQALPWDAGIHALRRPT
jgi:hypothetical protein